MKKNKTKNKISNNKPNNINTKEIKITPKNDIVFKKIFGDEGNENILKDFLESILDIKINSLKVDKNTEILPDIYNGKASRLDVLCELDNLTLVDVEVQVDTSKFSEERCLEYWSRLYTKALRKGHNYSRLTKTIGIWILDGEVFDEFKDFHSKWMIGETKWGFIGHFEHFEIHIIELQKFRKLDIIEPKKKEYWLSFIDQTKKEMVEMGKLSNERIEEAYKQYTDITSNDELMVAIINRQMAESDYITGIENAEAKGRAEGRTEGRAEGRAEGHAEGAEQNKKETAKKLLEMKMEIEQIMEVTGLTREEIEKLKE